MDHEWSRLDPRTIAVNLVRTAGSLIPLFIGLVVLGNRSVTDSVISLVLLAVATVVVAAADVVRWFRTSYRVTDERVELRGGLLTRTHVTIPRDRVRRVETTARLLHRLLGLTVVTVGTGERGMGEGDTLRLDAVRVAQAAELRASLLAPPERIAAGTSGTEGSVAGAAGSATGSASGAEGSLTGHGSSPALPGAPQEQVLERFRWSWAPYDVLSYWTLLVPLLLLSALFQFVSAAGVDPLGADVVDQGSGWLTDAPLGLVVAVVVVGGLAVGVIGSFALFVSTWWGYVLAREPNRTLRLQRGLFTTRVTTIDESRIRGAEFRQSYLHRRVRAGRLLVIAQGLSGQDGATSDRADALAPPLPVASADRLAALALDLPGSSPLGAALHPHPAAALRRRLARALLGTLAVSLLIWLAIGPGPAPLATAALAAVFGAFAVLYAADTYRGLGHSVSGSFLVTRQGAAQRRTTALACHGVIGWHVRQSWFQRRRGLATLVATTAAGSGAYEVLDVELATAVAVADAATPGLLTPIIDR